MLWMCSLRLPQNLKQLRLCDYDETLCSEVYHLPTKQRQALSVNGVYIRDKLFIDAKFPPAPRSLFYNSKRYVEDEIVWKRPHDIVTEEEDQNLKFCLFRFPLQLCDVLQGNIADCWLIAALTSILQTNSLLITSLFLTQETSSEGKYSIRLCNDGIWESITVDDLFPCNKDGNLIYATTRRKQLWVQLIEKAFAKLCSCYEGLDMGTTIDAFNIITGAACRDIQIRNRDINFIWMTLARLLVNGAAIITSCGYLVEDAEYRRVGLRPKHVYSILDICQIGRTRLLQLQDTFDSTSWNNSIDLEMRGLIYNNKDQSNRTMWISLDDFGKYFFSIGYCTLRSGWNEIVFSGVFPTFGKPELSCIAVTVLEKTEMDYILYQKNLSKVPISERYYKDMGLVIYKKTKEGYELIGYSGRPLQRFVNFTNVYGAGEYVIVPISFNHWHLKDNKKLRYNFVLKSNIKVLAQTTVLTSVTIRDVIIALTKRYGKMKNLSSILKAYELMDGYGEKIILVENQHHQYTRLECDFSMDCCRNFTTTRKSLKTIDNIPPYCGQVIAVCSAVQYSTICGYDHKITYEFTECAIHNILNRELNPLNVPEISYSDILHSTFELEH